MCNPTDEKSSNDCEEAVNNRRLPSYQTRSHHYPPPLETASRIGGPSGGSPLPPFSVEQSAQTGFQASPLNSALYTADQETVRVFLRDRIYYHRDQARRLMAALNSYGPVAPTPNLLQRIEDTLLEAGWMEPGPSSR